MMLDIRQADCSHAAMLSALALRSKAHWGYDEVFMRQCADELRVEPNRHDYFVGHLEHRVAGFYSLDTSNAKERELEALFVDPVSMGLGLGRQLFLDAVRRVGEDGGERIIIQSDPNAAKFYVRCGCEQVGESPSGSIANRFLPVFEFRISNDTCRETAS